MTPSTYGFLNLFNIVEHAKGEAVHDAITRSKADLIINPKFIFLLPNKAGAKDKDLSES